MKKVIQDLRYAFRQLVKMPGFTLTAVISLALGIGATTAVFSVVYAIIMDPYPYTAPDRMIHMRFIQPNGDTRGFGVTGSQWQQLRKSPVVEDSFLEDDWNLTVTGSDLPEDVQGVYLTSNAFEFLRRASGARPRPGSRLTPSTDRIPSPSPCSSYKFWQRHFNSDPGVLGKTIQLVRKNYLCRRRRRFALYLGRWRCLPPPEGHRRPGQGILCRDSPQARHNPRPGRRRPCIRSSSQFAKETPKHFPPDHGKLFTSSA